MKIPSLIGVACISAAPLALADNHSSSSPEWSLGAPLEMYNCSFTEGVNGYEQSQKFAANWNKWADENDAFGSHVAQLMWTEFSDGEYPTEFAWLGYWDSYASAGKDMDIRSTNGDEMYAEANKFIEQCAHSDWGAWVLVQAGDFTNEDHLTEFSDCVYKEGKNDNDLLAANTEYAALLADRGFDGESMGMAQLWPRAGAPAGIGNSPSFKWVVGHANFAAYSNFTNELWNKGLVMDFNRLYGEIVQCDSNRVYHSQVVRTPSS
ncbi:MAG: hypothetical protein CMD33_04335 [Flavobacteriales bacterium]|nr:hypothetical protein [Flavobacteriales bacterium]